MTAHLTKTKAGFELYLSPTARLADWTHLFRVDGKRQARAVAAQHNAKPWNF